MESSRRTFYSKLHSEADFGWAEDVLRGEDNAGLMELWSYDMRLAIRFPNIFAFGPFELTGVRKFPELDRPSVSLFDAWTGRLNRNNRTFSEVPFILVVPSAIANFTLGTSRHYWDFVNEARQVGAILYETDRVPDFVHRTQFVHKGFLYKRGGIGPRGGKQRPKPLGTNYLYAQWTTHTGVVSGSEIGGGWRNRA